MKPDRIRLKACLEDKGENAANTGGYLLKLTGKRTEKGLQWRMQNAGL